MVSDRVSQQAQEDALQTLQHLGGKYAGEIRSEFTEALEAARGMATTFAVGKLNPAVSGGLQVGRDEVNSILLNVLKSYPDFNGTYSCWEPDAIDGQDFLFTGGQNGNNEQTGRFTPYWTRGADGKIAVQPLVEYDTMDKHPNGVLKGGWYIGPRETLKESVLGPLPYIVQGKQVWLATLSVPIIVDGRFMGVAGTDYNLDFVQKISQEVSGKLFEGRGEVAIISDQGLIVAESRSPDLIGQHFQKVLPNEWQTALSAVQKGEELARLDADGTIVVFAPIELGRTGKPWSMMLKINKEIVLAKATELKTEMDAKSDRSMLQQIGAGVLISILAVLALWFSSRSVALPIRKAAQLAGAIQKWRLFPAPGAPVRGRSRPAIRQPRPDGRQPAGASTRGRTHLPRRPGGGSPAGIGTRPARACAQANGRQPQRAGIPGPAELRADQRQGRPGDEPQPGSFQRRNGIGIRGD